MRALEHEQRSHTKGVDGLKGKSQRRQIWINKVSLTEDTYCYDCWIVAKKPRVQDPPTAIYGILAKFHMNQ